MTPAQPPFPEVWGMRAAARGVCYMDGRCAPPHTQGRASCIVQASSRDVGVVREACTGTGLLAIVTAAKPSPAHVHACTGCTDSICLARWHSLAEDTLTSGHELRDSDRPQLSTAFHPLT